MWIKEKKINDDKIMGYFINQKCPFTEDFMEGASDSYQVKTNYYFSPSEFGH